LGYGTLGDITGRVIMRFASAFLLLTSMYVACPMAGADDPLVIEIWPGDVPGEVGDIGAERVRMSPE
jgi:hypothetical protein